MIVILLSVIAACAAAPRIDFGESFHQHHYPGPPSYFPPTQIDPGFAPQLYPYVTNNVFDTRQFWAQMANELHQLDEMLAQFSRTFPSISSTETIEGNQYKITIPLTGFDEKDIIVKAREGLLMVQAVHKVEGQSIGETSYLSVKTLPSSVNVTGSWTYENNVLKIVFPLKPGTKIDESTEAVITVQPDIEDHSREEMAPSSHTDGDADVGVRGDDNSNRELYTNEIPRNSVEATTYAVDLKNEVEFVPVRYR